MLQIILSQWIQSSIHALQQAASFPMQLSLPEIKMEPTKSKDHGDYATNIAMLLVKQLHKPPMEIAQTIVSKLLEQKHPFVQTVQVAKPGFINIRVSDSALLSVVSYVLEQQSQYGKTIQADPKQILVEFVSANPTGPLHLGHARGAFVGDVICRLLEASGHHVSREFYINDVGNQIQTLAKSIYARYQELFGIPIALEKDAYPGEYIIDIAKTIQSMHQDRWLHAKEEEWLPHFMEIGVLENLKCIRHSLESAHIPFDHWFSEKTLYEQGWVDNLIQAYRHNNMLYEAERAEGVADKVRREESKAAQYQAKQEGGTFLKTSSFGDDEDRILVRKNGQPAYMAGDLAYHWNKYQRGFDRLINVLGADHAGHVPRLRAGIQAMGLSDDRLDFVLVQMVRMIRHGAVARFSKRTGQIDLLDDLLQDIGNDVVRFAFLMRSPNTQFDFDLDQALEQSTKSPVFYVQYGHARMASILKKAKEKHIVPSKSQLDALPQITLLEEERDMLKKLDAFPKLVESAAWGLEPHRVLHFCQDLVGDFHSYFTKYRHTERILSANRELSILRVGLVAALKQTLQAALHLLGISAPEEMYLHHLQEEDSHVL